MMKSKHNHICYCGANLKSTGHEIGHNGCQRYMVEPPDLTLATLFIYKEQRGYRQHDCGCWSRWIGSSNSLTG